MAMGSGDYRSLDLVIAEIAEGFGFQNEKENRSKVQLDKYQGRGKKMFHDDEGEFVKKLRRNDRL